MSSRLLELHPTHSVNPTRDLYFKGIHSRSVCVLWIVVVFDVQLNSMHVSPHLVKTMVRVSPMFNLIALFVFVKKNVLDLDVK